MSFNRYLTLSVSVQTALLLAHLIELCLSFIVSSLRLDSFYMFVSNPDSDWSALFRLSLKSVGFNWYGKLTFCSPLDERSGWLQKTFSIYIISSRTSDLQREMRSLIFVLLATGAFAGTYYWFLFFSSTSCQYFSQKTPLRFRIFRRNAWFWHFPERLLWIWKFYLSRR